MPLSHLRWQESRCYLGLLPVDIAPASRGRLSQHLALVERLQTVADRYDIERSF
jgi:hypothetical protein